MKTLFIFFAILVCHTSVAQTYSPEIETKIKQVEENLFRYFKIEGKSNPTIKQKMASNKIIGLSIAIVNNYKIEWAKAYGWADSAEKRPVTTNTIFEPGSISKSLNSVGILKLAQDKQIDLYTDINNYLTSWKFPYDTISKGKKITIANLLSHTAGLTVHGFPGYELGTTIPTLPQILDGKPPANTSAVRSEFQPGIKHQYSGGGTTITQLILKDVTKQPYDTWMYENVLKPIGMLNSSFSQPQPNQKHELMATGYSRNGAVKGKYHIYPEQAAAGLWTTPSDLCKFIIETQLSLKGKSNKVLTQAQTQLQLKPYIDSAVGLGVFIDNRNGTKYFSHGASNEGFSGFYTGSFEDGNGIALVCNASDGSPLMDEFIKSVAQVYNWKGFNNNPGVLKKEVNLNQNQADKFLGYYKAGTFVNEIYKKNNHYYSQALANPWQIYFTSDSSFINLESTSEKTILFNKAGNVIGYKRVVEGKEIDTTKKIELLKLSNADLKKFVGDYKLDDVISIVLEGDVAYILEGKEKFEMKFISKNEFFSTEDPGWINQFVADANGNITSLVGYGEGGATLTFKKIK
ncbi:MAG TPA: serine hydrolase domain-containing protein [Bacteroidia bacterium]|nr:serine hydrolase domain-containing protein [Bacteroidia bacterium]